MFPFRRKSPSRSSRASTHTYAYTYHERVVHARVAAIAMLCQYHYHCHLTQHTVDDWHVIYPMLYPVIAVYTDAQLYAQLAKALDYFRSYLSPIKPKENQRP